MSFIQQGSRRPLLVLDAPMECFGSGCPNYDGRPCNARFELIRTDDSDLAQAPVLSDFPRRSLEYAKMCKGNAKEYILGYLAIMDESVSVIATSARLVAYRGILPPEFIPADPGQVLAKATERLMP